MVEIEKVMTPARQPLTEAGTTSYPHSLVPFHRTRFTSFIHAHTTTIIPVSATLVFFSIFFRAWYFYPHHLSAPLFCAQIGVGVQLVTYPALKKLGVASAPQAAAAAAPIAGHGTLGQSPDGLVAHSQEMEAFYAKQVQHVMSCGTACRAPRAQFEPSG